MKTTLLSLLLACCPLLLAAQIRFDENPSWQETLDKARAAGKYIFMDCYTDWCGPCKTLDKTVFSRPDVGDVYNARFVNVKYNMERGEGPALAKQYSVAAYPTLLFIDAATGEIVHRVVGARDATYFIEQADVALDSRDNLRGARQRYEESAKTLDDLQRYLDALAPAGASGEQARVVSLFIEALPDSARREERHWRLIERYLRDPLSAPLQRAFADRATYARALGAARVNAKLSSALQSASLAFLDRKGDDSARFDETRHAALLRLALTVEDPAAPLCAAHLLAAGHARRREYAAMLDVARDALKYNIVQGQPRPVFFMVYLVKLINAPDTSLLLSGVDLADELIASTPDAYIVSSFHEIKALLLDAAGQPAAAAAAREKGHRRPRPAAATPSSSSSSPAAPARVSSTPVRVSLPVIPETP
ncbi:MAG: thioredoxin family protein [Odoribacteraceae bacterium]|jgi:thiol-disulfide isomerase/thioredoxin|nr:thioredoxin family protein [Odoribacteraceae bacterium]